MKNIAAGLIMLFAFASTAFCQPQQSTERDTLQSLLDEVRQLRMAIQGMTGAGQRVQIALYGLQMQDSAVSRATQRLDNLRNKCSALLADRQHTDDEVQRLESGLSAGTLTAVETSEVKSRLPVLKHASDQRAAEVQACQAAESEASVQFSNDQAKLAELQDRITRLDKALEDFEGKGK